MKKLILALAAGFIITAVIGVYAQTTQNEISNSLIRLHVVANSDSAEDQAVKLKVRDAIIEAMKDKLDGVSRPSQAEKIIQDNISYIEQLAANTLIKEGYHYGASAQMGNYSFPSKQYHNITLPAGNYNALRVTLGEGKGQNWWCVMFPPLCIIDTTIGKAGQDSLSLFKENMSQQSYDIITVSDESEFPVQIKFKIVELFSETAKMFWQR